MDTTLLISIIILLAVVGILTYARMKSGNKFEVKNPEIAIALIPIVLFLLLTGKIQKFEFGDLKIETAFVEASQAAIVSQVTSLTGLPVESLRQELKGGVGQIPELMERLDLEVLPVVDAQQRFAGLVDRSRLTASLIIDVTNYLESEK